MEASDISDSSADITVTNSVNENVVYYIYKSTLSGEPVFSNVKNDCVNNANGQFTLSSLDANKTYYIYAWTEDIAGNVSNCVATDFKTLKTDIEGATVLIDQDSFIYNGESKKPTVTVTLNEATIDEADYDISYSNTNGTDEASNTIIAGEVTVTVTAKADSDYTGTATSKPTYTISKIDMPTLTIDGIAFVGETLKVPTSYVAPSDGGIISYTWLRGDSVVGEGSSYTLSDDDAGSRITLKITAERNYNPVSATSEIVNYKKFKYDIKDGTLTVPETLAENESLNTPEKMEAKLKLSIESLLDGATTKIYDVKLMTSLDGGITWVEVTKENFPKDGVTVLLPYPEGTNATDFNFTVTHMFTTGDNAGSIEVLNVEKTADGLKFKVYSLSPIAVGYKQIPKNDTETDNTKTNASSNQTTESKSTNGVGTGDDSNPMLLIILLAVSVMAIVGVGVIYIKRRKKD